MKERNDEQRRFLRLPKPYRVQAREFVFPIAQAPLIDANVADISKGGLCIEAQSPMPQGTRLHITLHIPLLNKFTSSFFKVYENDAEQFFEAIAEVAWTKPENGTYLLGLRFINVDDEVAEGIERLIEKAFRDME